MVGDPRSISEPEEGYVYESSRGGRYQVLFVNEGVVLLRDMKQDYHRLEPYDQFVDSVGSGMFTHLSEFSSDVDWSQVSYVGNTLNERLHDAGFNSFSDVIEASDSELFDVNGLGANALKNLREFTQR